jgi:hypothetical protein
MAEKQCSNADDPIGYMDLPEDDKLVAKILQDDNKTYLCFDLRESLIRSILVTENYNMDGKFMGVDNLKFNEATIRKIKEELKRKLADFPEDREIKEAIQRLNELFPQNNIAHEPLPDNLAKLLFRILECLYWTNSEGNDKFMKDRKNSNRESCKFINFLRYARALLEEINLYDEATRTAILNLPFSGYKGAKVHTFGQFISNAIAGKLTPCLGTYISNIGEFYNNNKRKDQPEFKIRESGRIQHTQEWFENKCAPFSTSIENSDPKLNITLAKLKAEGGRRKNRRVTMNKRSKRNNRRKNTRKN